MAEKVARLGIKRDNNFLYYIKGTAVWKVPRKKAGTTAKGRSERVQDVSITRDMNYMYFVDRDGDISRSKRSVGGQKRKRSTMAARKATRKATRGAKKAKAKKPAKKGAAKKPARAAKKGKKR